MPGLKLPNLEDEEDEDGTQVGQDEENEGHDAGDEFEEDAEEGEGSDDEEPETDEQEEVLESHIPRRQRAVQSLRKRAQEAERRAQEAERRAEEAERRAADKRQQQEEESETDEATKLALMTDSEKLDYKFSKFEKRLQGLLSTTQVNSADRQDKDNYARLMREDKLARRFESEVEELHASLMKQGKPTGREVILNYIIGQKSRSAASSGKPRQQRREAERRISRERVNNSAGRSDVSSERRRGGKTLEQRLEGVKI